MNKDQVTGILERLVYAAAMAVLTKLVAKGYIDQDLAAYIAAGAVTAVGGIWAWWINRPQALMRAAAQNSPETKFVTDDKTAISSPETNIVSNLDVKVVNK